MNRSKKTGFGRNNDEAFFIKEKLDIEALTVRGDFVQARRRADRLCKKFKNNPEAWFISGVVCGSQGDFQQAIISCKRTISLAPNMPVSYLNLGIALRMTGQLSESLKALKKSIELQPDLVNAYRELGIVSHLLGNYDEAVKYITRTTDYAPNDPMVWISLGNIHEQNNNYSDAESCYRKALEVDENSIAACANLGNMLKVQHKIGEAESCYKKFLLKNSDSIDLIYNLAFLYHSEGRLADAESYYRRAIALDASHAASNNNLGLVLLLQNKFEDAINVFEALIKLKPNNADARRNLALVYRELNELSKAEDQLNNILKVEPENIPARQDRSLFLLQSGNFKRGWKEYEWRLKNSTNCSDLLPFPIWDGSDPCNKTILLLPEQGIGDEIMFSSCVMDLARVANSVVLICDARMEPLFERSFPGVKILGQTQENNLSNNLEGFIEKLSDVDMQLSVASLPMYFRNNIHQFEQASAGYLFADTLAVEKWKARFSATGNGLKVGISWRGGHISNTKLKRSISLEQWHEILELPDVQFINLQYGECASELDSVSDLFGVKIHEWQDSDPLLNMDDFAAKIKALDLVISIDNSTVHLAGALGADTWLLQPYSSDWRWLIGQVSSYWYSSVRQYRQRESGEWGSVLCKVAADLSEINLQG